MSTAAPLTTEVEVYLARVRAALADVPADERNELLAEVEASLYDTAAETGGSVAARLGPPEDFAAELRSAAGLHLAPPAEAPRVRDTIERLLANDRVTAGRRVAHELAPIWWVVRAYVVVAALALLLDRPWSNTYRALPRFGSAGGGLALIAVAVVASVVLGLWSRRSGRTVARSVAIANIVLLAAAIPVAHHIVQRTPPQFEVATVPAPIPGLAYNGVPLSNIYPYSRGGKLLHDVFLYDAQGRPLNVSTVVADPNRRVPKTVTGRRVFNVFPIRYFEPGTRLVRHPDAAPPVKTPRLVTRPLRRR